MKTEEVGKYKRVYRFAASLAALVMAGVPFAVLWLEYYNDAARINQSFALRGNWLIIAIYFVLLFVFTNVYGGFKIGYQKAESLALSQGITLCATNILMYGIIALLARKMVEFWPMLLLFAVQIVVTTVLSTHSGIGNYYRKST